MPSVESGEVVVIGSTNGCLVECLVVWVLQCYVLEAFVLLNETISDYLDLWLMWNCFQIWMEDRSLGVNGFAVAV